MWYSLHLYIMTNQNNIYISIIEFKSRIFRNLTIPKGAELELRYGSVFYYEKKPILYFEDSYGLVMRKEKRND